VASYGLAGSALPFPERPLDRADWIAFINRVADQRLSGFLMSAIDDGAFPVTEDQQKQAAGLRWHDAMWVLRLEHSLREIDSILSGSNLDYRVLKGPALANTVYADPALRSYVDIDILVPPTRFDESVALLTSDGGVRTNPEPVRGFVQRFGKSVAVTRPNQSAVDIHRTLAPGPYGLRIDLAQLFASKSPFRIAGRTLFGIGPEERFLHACYHATLGDNPPRLVPLRDVVETLRSPEFSLQRAHRLWTDWGASLVVAVAVRTAWATLGVVESEPLAQWAESFRPRRTERKVLEVFRGTEEHDDREAIRMMMSAVPSMRGKAQYLRAQVLPSRSYLSERGEGYVRHWWRGVRIFITRNRPSPRESG
jgi:hypothetical protein